MTSFSFIAGSLRSVGYSGRILPGNIPLGSGRMLGLGRILLGSGRIPPGSFDHIPPAVARIPPVAAHIPPAVDHMFAGRNFGHRTALVVDHNFVPHMLALDSPGHMLALLLQALEGVEPVSKTWAEEVALQRLELEEEEQQPYMEQIWVELGPPSQTCLKICSWEDSRNEWVAVAEVVVETLLEHLLWTMMGPHT